MRDVDTTQSPDAGTGTAAKEVKDDEKWDGGSKPRIRIRGGDRQEPRACTGI
jgi:hypothetical protein